VIAGIDAACAAGFERLRLNAVILRGRNDDEVSTSSNSPGRPGHRSRVHRGDAARPHR
jgi:hypothetical protein